MIEEMGGSGKKGKAGVEIFSKIIEKNIHKRKE